MKPRIGLTSSSSFHEDRLMEMLERAYVTALTRVGALPFILPVMGSDEVDDVLASLDGLLLSGGGDIEPARYGQIASPELGPTDPDRDAYELALARAAAERGIPMLGICRGCQVINVAFDGTLVQHLPDVTDLEHRARDRSLERVHTVAVQPGSLLQATLGEDVVGVNSLHHQAVADVGTGLRAVGWAEDGTIEAVEGLAPTRILGVQWHPELLLADARHAALFDWLVLEAAQAPLRIGQAAAA